MAVSSHGTIEQMKTDDRKGRRITRRQVLGMLGGAAAAVPLLGASVFSCGSGGTGGGGNQPPPQITDDQLLDQIESAAFQYFWNEASSQTGLVKDRALANGGDTRTLSSIAATGFGLTALCIGAQRGYGVASDIRARVLATLQALLNTVAQQNGWFYHFLDMNTGQPAQGSEVSSVDHAILLCGVLTARQFYAQDAQIPGLATQIYNRVNFPWMLNGGNAYALAWTPNNGFTAQRYDVYAEMMMLYLLGIGSTANPAPAQTWNGFTRPNFTYQNFTYITNTSAPLFIHQYSHAWFDFRNKKDAYADYFQNSVVATQAHKAFCQSLNGQFSDYTSSLFGITASDSKNGYVVWGGPPAIGPIDGSVVPCACAGSVPFQPADCIGVLRNMRFNFTAQAWRKYGFVDAFNPLNGWSDSDVIGIDLGITMLMAENYRTGFVWQTFMANPEAQAAMTAAGF